MSIWPQELSLESLNKRNENSMMDYLDIKFTEIGDNYLCATMPATDKTRQPRGIIHGGANVVLAEGIASTGANVLLFGTDKKAVGLDINANHIRMVADGIVTGKAYPVHLGNTTQVWQVDITNEQNKLTCVCRMTAMVIAAQ